MREDDVDAKIKQADVRGDQLWYKDAIIYQLHVKSFFDSNNDGVGDFPGLISKLDYIADLGVNTIWLLPFYPSPGWTTATISASTVTFTPITGRLVTFGFLSARLMRAAFASSPNWSSITRRISIPGFSERATLSPARRGGTFMSGRTMTKNMPARASSLSTASGRIGVGIQWRELITGTGFIRISRI